MKRTKWYWISLAAAFGLFALAVALLTAYADWWMNVPRALRWLAYFAYGWLSADFAKAVNRRALAARELGADR